MSSQPPPPDWYADPELPGQLRYWDGAQWTEHRAPSAETATPQQTETLAGGVGVPPPAAAKTNGLAIAALVLSIVWLGGLGAIAAVILGIMAIRQINASNGTQGGKGLAMAGTIIGGIGIIGAVLLWSLVIVGFSVSDDFDSFFECIEQAESPEELDDC